MPVLYYADDVAFRGEIDIVRILASLIALVVNNFDGFLEGDPPLFVPINIVPSDIGKYLNSYCEALATLAPLLS